MANQQPRRAPIRPRPPPTAAARVSPGALNGAGVTSGRPPLTASAPARAGVTGGHCRPSPCRTGNHPREVPGFGIWTAAGSDPGSSVFLPLVRTHPELVWPILASVYPLLSLRIEWQQQEMIRLQSEDSQWMDAFG